MADEETAETVSPVLVHFALILSYMIFGGGSLICKIGIYGSSPVMFELVREMLTLVVLWTISACISKPLLPQRQHTIIVLSMGSFLFCNQACYYIGLKLTDPVSAATWQASIPGFTALICSTLGIEVLTLRKTICVALACLGAASVALLREWDKTLQDVAEATEAGAPSDSYLLGHIVLGIGVMSVPGFIITTRSLRGSYSALTVTTWAFTGSAALMGSAAVILSASPSVLELICHDDDPLVATLCIQDPWRIPPNMMLPVLYEVVASSVGAWSILAWACRHTTPTIVNLYSVVQPLAAALFAQIVLDHSRVSGLGIQAAGYHHLAGLTLIVGGLVLAVCEHEGPEVANTSRSINSERSLEGPSDVDTLRHTSSTNYGATGVVARRCTKAD